MFSGTEEDDLFTTASSSNLANLFGTQMTIGSNNNSSLTYTAPKQPKIGGQETPKSAKLPTQSTVVLSKFVDVFKLSDKNHKSEGKCGFAIIAYPSINIYELILYKSKQDVIMRTKFKQDFVFTIQTNNFACFCDSNMQQWSVHFDGEEDLEQFAQQIKSNGGKITYYNQSTDSSDNVKQPLSETEENKNEKDSDSHSDTSQNKTKANILSRMAKMGQSILPTAAPKTASDSQTSSNSEYVIVNGQLLPMASINQNFGSSFVNPLQNQMVSSLPNQFILPQVSDSMHVFIAENRTHNCEVRMNMSQFSAKLDKVLEELNKNKTGVSNYVRTEDQENKLEESKNIIKTLENKHKHYEEIIQDNKQNIEELLRQIENQEKKILDQELQIRDLIESKNILEASQKNIDEQKILVENLKAELIQKESGLEQIDKLFKDKDSENLKLLECNDNLAKQIANTDSKVDMFNKKLKQSMNVLYQKMMEHFEDESAAFQSTQIKKILSHHLKTLTFSIIQEFENDFKNTEQIEQKSNTVAPPVPTFDEF